MYDMLLFKKGVSLENTRGCSSFFGVILLEAVLTGNHILYRYATKLVCQKNDAIFDASFAYGCI